MYSLKEGVVLKLVEEMKSAKVESWKDDPKAAALLQIRCIIPVLEEGDLWPNRGFFLKVSDASHALYVSLSRSQNEMILANRLQLGQFIHVRRLEPADPLPLLRGLAPIPGRRPCLGTPQDIVSPTRLLNLLHPQNQNIKPRNRRRIVLRRGSSDYSSISSCSRATSTTGKSSDDDSVTAPTPPRASKRRSWSESEILGVKEIYDSSAAKNEMKLSFRSASANVSPVRRGSRYGSSDDNSSLVSRNRVAAKRSAATTKPRIMQTTSHSHSHSVCNVVCDRKGGAESRISWSSLPSNLVSHGKEVIRQRDVAVQAAVDALQEACASERLLNSLSIMSQFPLAEEGNDLQPFVDKFFNLQQDLAQTGLIMQPEISNIGLERKKNANAWIKSAIALDLSPWCRDNKSSSDDHEHVDHIHCCNNNIPGLGSGSGSGSEWSRGSSAGAAAELASALQEECKKLFLIYAEKYLDEVDRKSSAAEHDVEMAEMMSRVKMVSEWLGKEGQGCDCDACEEAQTYARVRDKIYCILLNHVDKTTMAFDRFKASL